ERSQAAFVNRTAEEVIVKLLQESVVRPAAAILVILVRAGNNGDQLLHSHALLQRAQEEIDLRLSGGAAQELLEEALRQLGSIFHAIEDGLRHLRATAAAIEKVEHRRLLTWSDVASEQILPDAFQKADRIAVLGDWRGGCINAHCRAGDDQRR